MKTKFLLSLLLSAWGPLASYARAQGASTMPQVRADVKTSPQLSDTEEAYASAFASYLKGAFDATASSYRYLTTRNAADPEPAVSLALTLRDDGKPEDAAAQWLKASLMAPEDPFIWNQRGWSYLALARYRDARESFNTSIKISSSSPSTAEAYFGLGLAYSLDDNAKAAFSPLQSALMRSPYLVPAAALELGRLAITSRHFPEAIPFLTMSLGQDSLQVDVAKLLARVYEKTNQTQAAWQAYKLVLDMDPADAQSQAREEKTSHYISGRPTDYMPLLRLARPLLQEPKPETPSPALRVGIFSNPAGELVDLTHFYFMTGSDFRLVDTHIGEIDRGKPDTQWEIVFRVDNRVIEVRDSFNNIRYVTKQPFRIEPDSSGTTLIKNPELTDIKGINIGDRELRGAVEIIPTPMGFRVVNEVPIEQYLFSVIGQTLPEDSPLEAYKAMAVLMRSRVLALRKNAAPNPERMDLCDSEHCIPYLGLSQESIASTRAVRETRGATIALDSGPLEYHNSCGWATVSGIQDKATPGPGLRSAGALERLLHGYPEPSSFDDASAHVPAIWTRWVRLLDASELRRRIDKVKPIGAIRRIRVLRRSPLGRVAALEVTGSYDMTTLEGEKAIADFLSPGSLRSTLLSFQPIYDGRSIERLLVWGAGTGHGRGMCVAGAVGQAQLGHSARAILAHYFPKARFSGLAEPEIIRPRAARARKTARPGKNPRQRPPRRKRRLQRLRSLSQNP